MLGWSLSVVRRGSARKSKGFSLIVVLFTVLDCIVPTGVFGTSTGASASSASSEISLTPVARTGERCGQREGSMSGF